MKKWKTCLGALLTAAALLGATALPAALPAAAEAPAAPATPTASTLEMVDEKTNTLASSSVFAAYRVVSWDASHGNMQLTPAFCDAMRRTLQTDGVGNLSDGCSDAEILAALNTLNAGGANASRAAAVLSDLAVALRGAAPAAADYTASSGYFAKDLQMPDGYYLIVETQNNAADRYVISKPMLARIPDDSVVYVKHSPAQIVKKIVDGSSGSDRLTDASAAAVGDTVRYRTVATIPAYASDATALFYQISDALGDGLTLDASSLTVTLAGPGGTPVSPQPAAGTNYTVETAAHGFTLQVASDRVKEWGNAGDELILTYSATLGGDGVQTGSAGNPNTVTLTYTNNPAQSGDYKEDQDTVITFSLKLTVKKTDPDGNALAGAEFRLYRLENGQYAALGGAGSGSTFTFGQLKPGSYKLVETKAPDGYNRMADLLFTVSGTYSNGAQTGLAFGAEGDFVTAAGNDAAQGSVLACWNAGDVVKVGADGNLTLTVADSKGFSLPGSGGRGTGLLTAGGAAMLLLAGGIFFVRRRRRASGRA